MEFDWDAGNWPKCGKHGVSKEEIEDVLDNYQLVIADPFPLEVRFDAIGQTEKGRWIFVVFCWRGEKRRPISARYMHLEDVIKYV